MEVFDAVRDTAPSLLFLDDVDLLIGRKETTTVGGGSEKGDKRMVMVLCGLLDRIRSDSPGLGIVASCSNPARLAPALRRRFDLDLDLGAPSSVDRSDILRLLIPRYFPKLGSVDEELGDVLSRIGDCTPGYTGADLENLCRVARQSTSVLPPSLTVAAWETGLTQALSRIRPSALREITSEIPRISWADIGGQEQIKRKLRQVIDWPLRHPEKFARMGIQPPRGILLYGPPGCSKTMIAKAAAAESRLNFLSVKGPELFSKWVGESERGIRDLFAKARRVAPALIFFDEIDALASTRSGDSGGGVGSGGSSGVGDRVLAQLLTELDGIEGRTGVMVLAATNRPDAIDPALLRPGRFDRLIFVPLPDPGTRREIFRLQFQHIPMVAEVGQENSGDDDWLGRLLEATEGFSGAEVVALCQEAAMAAMEEAIDAGADECSGVAVRHIESALTLVTPRTTPKQLEICERFSRHV